MNENFLHMHSTYSVGDSAQMPEDIVRRVQELGGKNVTLTDHRTLLGVDDFMAAGEKYGINTIPGVEAEVSMPADIIEELANGVEESYKTFQKVRNHMVIVPFNYRGFQTISYAMKDANTNLFHVGKTPYPCLTDEMLEKHFRNNPDVMVTSACVQGPIAYILLINFRLKERMQKYLENQAMYKDEYDEYEGADAQEKEAKEAIKELKKKVTAEKKYLADAYTKRIQRIEAKVEKFEGNPDKQRSAMSELSEARTLVESAKAALPLLEQKIEYFESVKEQAGQIKAKTKKAHNAYAKALVEIDVYRSRMVDESVLYETAKKRLIYMKNLFSHFYIELQNHGLESEHYVMPILLKLADETNTPIIAANDAHITDASDESVEARRLIRFNFFKKAETVSPADREMYIKSDEELVEALSKVIPEERAKEAVQNVSILNECKVIFPHDSHYPKVKGGKSFDQMLEDARQARIAAGTWNQTYQDRLEYEIGVIKKMGYVDYHMVVEHFCRIGRLMGRVPDTRRNEIYDHFADLEEWVNSEGFDIGVGIGPGRGSAAGSLVCYMLGITNIDPIKYNLLFERFLNPERVSMPDIDTDIATSIRPMLIAYLRWYYGENAVCSIATTNTYAPKGAIQLAGRDRADQLFSDKDKEGRSKYLHNKSYYLSDMILATPDITMADCEEYVMPKIKDDPELMLLWNRAKLIENRVSGTGIHAGGVIISDNDNVNDYVPLAWNEEKKVWVAQCDMVMAEAKGLLKMDVLGLNTLDIINTCIQLVKKHHGTSIDMNKVPFEAEVFKNIYASGNTNGVFQFESSGMKSMLTQFKPTCFEDIILLVAAYRPGPMQYLDDVVAVKNGRKKLAYKHPMLESILSYTYGATIYQEQVMMIFQKLAGYSLGGADLVRRAMSKKKMEKLAHEREAFIHGDEERGIDGCLKRGVSEETANTIFDEMMEFAKYAFNQSHAAAYAYVSYQTAWLKYHYPAEFLCALFNCKKQDKYAPIIADCGTYGIELLQPDVNSSYYDFVIENGNIRYGIGGIKGIGEANIDTINSICEERKNGFYTSINNFLKRTTVTKENVTTLISKEMIGVFVNAGMFDSMGYNRENLLNALTHDFIYDKAKIDTSELRAMISSLDVSPLEKDSGYNFKMESELLGTVCSERPLAVYGNDEAYGCNMISDLPDGDANVFGFVIEIEKSVTKKNKPIIKMQIQGKTGECTVLFMSRAYEKFESTVDTYLHKVVKVSGRANEKSIFCDTIKLLSAEPQSYLINLNKIEYQRMLLRLNNELHKDKQSGDDVKVCICMHFNANEIPLRVAKSASRWCSSSVIAEAKKIGLPIEKA